MTFQRQNVAPSFCRVLYHNNLAHFSQTFDQKWCFITSHIHILWQYLAPPCGFLFTFDLIACPEKKRGQWIICLGGTSSVHEIVLFFLKIWSFIKRMRPPCYTFYKLFSISTWFRRDTEHGLDKQVVPLWQLPPPKVPASLPPSLTMPAD